MSRPDEKFRDERVRPVRRHWLCTVEDCGGEMQSTGVGFTQLETTWEHRCDKCGYRDGSSGCYPCIVYL